MKQGFICLTVTHTLSTWNVDSTDKSYTINRQQYEDKVYNKR